MIGGNDFASWWGYPGATDLTVQIVARAVKHGGFTVVLLQPGTEVPACTATDTAIKRGHLCNGFDALVPDPDRPQRIKPMVTAAVARVTERYGGIPNVAIDLHASNLSVCEPNDNPCTVEGTRRFWVTPGVHGRGGLLTVPPSVMADGTVFRVWSTSEDAGS